MSKTILIVDDFESSRNILERTLANAGYTVLKGSNGEEALKLMIQEEIDLVITDLNMPLMDGMTLLKEIRATSQIQYTPVILLTTNSKSAQKEKAVEAGVTGWIEKPFQVDVLLSSIKKIVK